ncbi:MAG: hypothetical protein KGL04_03565 [Elusimicrobia bacterium]|nr:hypothetical protein [Elusimicrobiota bacterium]
MEQEPRTRSFFSSQKIWAVLLVADSFFVILFGGALAATLYEHWQAPPAVPVLFQHQKPEARPPKPAAQHPAAQPKAVQAGKSAASARKPPAAPVAKQASSTANPQKAHPVVFKLRAPHARSVDLAGAFLIREGGRESMRRKKGAWTLKVYLMPGSYRYYFLVNGKKRLYPTDARRKNGDSLLVVPAK